MSIKNKKNNISKWIRNYTNSYKNSVDDTFFNMKNIYQTLEVFKKIKKNQKIHIFGNGGSSSIASHFSMDLTNNSNIVCLNYNDPAIITCYSNDFGYRDWIARVISKYGNKNDILILISSSGNSKNVLEGVKAARKKKFSRIITLTGWNKNNLLKKKGDINFWVNSKNYNTIENIHQFWLLMMVDLVKH